MTDSQASAQVDVEDLDSWTLWAEKLQTQRTAV